MIRTNIHFTKDQRDAMLDIATGNDTKPSVEHRKAVDVHIDRNEPARKRGLKLRKAASK